MALDSSTLQASLLKGFVSSMTDSSFSSTVASSVNTYCGTGIITAGTLKGTVSAGVFMGSGSGTVTVSIASKDIEDVCTNMRSDTKLYGDAYLAKELASIIDKAVTNGEFNIIINGSATAGSTTTSFTGVVTTDVTWQGDASTLESSLKDAMVPSMTDTSFATAIATAVTTYLTSASITVKGENSLEGAKGAGVMA